jgi:hypothetical protein
METDNAHVVALDRFTGRPLWDAELSSKTSHLRSHQVNRLHRPRSIFSSAGASRRIPTIDDSERDGPELFAAAMIVLLRAGPRHDHERERIRD